MNWFTGIILVAFFAISFSNTGRAQEALRQSLAGDISAETFRRAQNTLGYYNLLLGPAAWRFSSALEMDYDSNVRLQQSQNAEGDLVFRPNLNTQMHWPLTLKNSLDFSLGVGYSAYATHSDLDQFFITPGSGFLFNIYVGVCVINLHDRISITENSYENPGARGSNNGSFISLQNTIGASALFDLNKLVANVGYDHVNYLELSGSLNQPDSASENFFANVGARVRPELLVGLEAGAGLINYDQSAQVFVSDARQFNIGAFASAQISQYINARLDAGYTQYEPTETSTNFFSSSLSGFYFDFAMTHRINQHINYTVMAGHSTDLSSYGQLQQYYFVRFDPNWNFLHKYQLTTPISWQNGTRYYGRTATYNQFNAAITLGRRITKKLSGSIGYQFIKETSDEADLNYTVNIVSLNFTYQF